MMSSKKANHIDDLTGFGPNGNIFRNPSGAFKVQWKGLASHNAGVIFTSVSCYRHGWQPGRAASYIIRAAQNDQVRRVRISGGCIHGDPEFVRRVKEICATFRIEVVWMDWKSYASSQGYPLVGQVNLILRFVDRKFPVVFKSWKEVVEQESLQNELYVKAEEEVLAIAMRLWEKQSLRQVIREAKKNRRLGLRRALAYVTDLQDRGVSDLVIRYWVPV